MIKKICLVALAMMMVCTTINAQENRERKRPDKTEMIKLLTERMAKEYELTQNQTEQLQVLNTQYADKLTRRRPMNRGEMGGRMGQRPQRGAWMGQGMGQRPSKEEMEKKREEAKKATEAYEKELKNIMGEEKFAQYKEKQKQRANNFQKRKKQKTEE